LHFNQQHQARAAVLGGAFHVNPAPRTAQRTDSSLRSIIFSIYFIDFGRYGGDCMINLAAGKCVACRGGEPTLTDAEIEDLSLHIHGWEVKEVDGMKRLSKTFKFKNFIQALEFTNKIGAVAEEENHHPLIVTEWGKVMLQWWTHKIGGLHKNDFIMAAKSDEIYG
jgi:4a-hydroxytetrahydrobiopterin dehydratase